MSVAEIVDQKPAQASEDRRVHERFAVRIKASLYTTGHVQSAVIDDLSAGGVGLEGVIGVTANEPVGIELGDGRLLSGIIVWSLAGCCGVQFHAPLPDDDPLLRAAAG